MGNYDGSNPRWPPTFQTGFVHGIFLDNKGAAEVGYLTFKMDQSPVKNIPSGVLIYNDESDPIIANLDVNGAVTIELPATNDPDVFPLNFTWQITESWSGRKYHIPVLAGVTLELATVFTGVEMSKGVIPPVIMVNGTVYYGAGPTGARPNAVTVGAGGSWYDTTLQEPIWSNGAIWQTAEWAHVAATVAHGATGAVVGTTNAQTLTNKTFTDNVTTIQDNTDNTKKFQFDAANIATGTTRTLGVPNANTTLLGQTETATAQNKTLDNTNVVTVKDTNLTIQDDADTTKQFKIDASGITSGTTRTVKAPNIASKVMGIAPLWITTGSAPLKGTFDATKEIQRAIWSGSGTADASGFITFNLPNTVVSILGCDFSITIGNDTTTYPLFRTAETSLTGLIVLQHRLYSTGAAVGSKSYGVSVEVTYQE